MVVARAPVLGVSVGRAHVRAVVWWNAAIRWAGAAPYDTLDALADAVARLASEAELPVRRARVVLERDVVQLRSIVPAPPLKPAALRRYVALEAPRLFRKNGAPLVTDGVRVPVTKQSTALWAGAAAEPLVRAVLAGCAQAGLVVEGLGPAADVLPHATRARAEVLVFQNGGTTELLATGPKGTWQSRLVLGSGDRAATALHAALEAFGADASAFAAAFGAAVARPRLSLWPPEAMAARARHSRRRLIRLMAIGALLWVLAGGMWVSRLAWTRQAATRALGAAAGPVDSALAVRRQLSLAQATLATVSEIGRRRSRHLELLAAVTQALRDSTYLVAFQITPEGVVRLAGYAPVAARAVADLERMTILRDVRLEGPVTRERGAGGGGVERDRFAVVARLEVAP